MIEVLIGLAIGESCEVDLRARIEVRLNAGDVKNSGILRKIVETNQ